MGKKKGLASHASIPSATSCDTSQERLTSDEAIKVHHVSASCITYVAANGTEYMIDVALMEQLNVASGTRRRVFRHEEPGKFCWNKWQFEAATAGCRHYTPPKCVALALEERFQFLQKQSGNGSAAHQWRHTITELHEAALWRFLQVLEKHLNEVPSEEAAIICSSTKHAPNSDNAADQLVTGGLKDDPRDESLMAGAVAHDESLRQVLADRVLQAPWPEEQLLRAVRCLLRIGWQPAATSCRLVALGNGSLALLRLLLETGVDVCGLVLFELGQKKGKRNQAEGSWVQRNKNALRALMARGAVLGDDAPRSKLLKKLEEDGDILWMERALDGLVRAHPELPDCVFERLRTFC